VGVDVFHESHRELGGRKEEEEGSESIVKFLSLLGRGGKKCDIRRSVYLSLCLLLDTELLTPLNFLSVGVKGAAPFFY
jgi:hypothetical protein